MSTISVRSAAWFAAVLACVHLAPAFAQSYDQRAFVQVGDGDSRTRSFTLGYTRAFRTIGAERASHWDLYGEASLGRWFAHGNDDVHRAFTQIGLTPVARYSFAPGGAGWFIEAGVGLNLITPLFHSGERRFSTALNFGDHLAIGTRFGDVHENEIALRFQHFSNGGTRQPNPGEDFVQLRYARHF